MWKRYNLQKFENELHCLEPIRLQGSPVISKHWLMSVISVGNNMTTSAI